MSDRIQLWAVSPSGDAVLVQRGMGLQLATTRAIVIAGSPEEARAAAEDDSFKVGIKNATADEPAELEIAGEIGNPYEGCDAKSVSSFLRANKGKQVNVSINSGGGLAYDGLCIHNAFLQHDATVTTIVNGIAGSAATMISVGGKPAKIFENSTFFVHRAALLAYGNRDVMDEAMAWLDQVDQAIAKTYKAKTNRALDKMLELMKGSGKRDGTIMTAKEAVDAKFCDEMIPLKRNGAQNAVEFDGPPQTQQFVETARAMRVRSRSVLFVPAE